MKRGARGTTRRAVTLIEAIAVVVVLALAVPPMLVVTADAVDARLESVRIAEATALAQGIAEHVLADAHAMEDGTGGAPGFDGLADASAYTDDPTNGLRTRLAWLAEGYESRGMTWDVEIGELVNAEGDASGDAAVDLYRRIRVLVDFAGSRGQMRVAMTLMVGGGA